MGLLGGVVVSQGVVVCDDRMVLWFAGVGGVYFFFDPKAPGAFPHSRISPTELFLAVLS